MTTYLHRIIRFLPKVGQTAWYSVGKKDGSSKYHYGVELRHMKENHYRIRMDNRTKGRMDKPFTNQETDDIIKAVKKCFEQLGESVRELHQKQLPPDYELQLDVYLEG